MCSLLSTSILSDKKILYCSNYAKTSENKRQQHQVTILILWRWCELRKYKSWMMIWSLQWLLQFKQLQINPKKVFWTSTGLKRMASALALQCYTVRAMKTHTLGAGQLVELILNCERNETWRQCELQKHKLWMKISSSQWLLQFKQLQIILKKFLGLKGHGFISCWSPKDIFQLYLQLLKLK